MFFNLFFLLYLTNINSFIKKKSYDLSFKKPNCISIYCTNNKLKEKIIDKSKNYLKLIRSENIIPTLLLSFTGGWITNPSIYNLLRSKTFITSTLITQFIMSSSMIMNDIYDYDIDKINNPKRPLTSGKITIKEATILNSILLFFSEYLNIFYLPNYLHIIVHLSIINIIMYTPILKKILFIKNISCASLVTFSIFFASLTSIPSITILKSTNKLIELNNNFELLSILLKFIFLGSLYNELLLDISDYEGDKINNIKTIPVIFGKKYSWIFANIILYINILFNTFSLGCLYNFDIGIILSFICLPCLFNLYKINKSNYSKEIIRYTVFETNKTLFLSLLYFCSIIYINLS